MCVQIPSKKNVCMSKYFLFEFVTTMQELLL